MVIKNMNRTILILSIIGGLLLGLVATASCVTVKTSKNVTVGGDSLPPFLQGATITVTLKDGRQSTVPAELFKVVPRKVQTIEVESERTACSLPTKAEAKKNRISGLLGRGSQGGLESRRNGPLLEVESKYGVVGGVQYQRLLNDVLSIGGQVQSSNTLMIILGVEL